MSRQEYVQKNNFRTTDEQQISATNLRSENIYYQQLYFVKSLIIRRNIQNYVIDQEPVKPDNVIV